MRRVGDKLHLTYTITNRTDHAIRVFDHFADHERERIVVHNDDYLLATVAFTHGYVDHRTADKHAGESVGRMRRLDAGSSVDGAAVVPIPLEAWLDYYTIRPLELGITHAVVEVDVCLPFRSEFLDRIRGPSPPQPHAVVGPCSPQALRGERLALPEGAMSWIPRPPSIEWYDYEQAMRRIDRNNRERYRRARERDAGRR